MNPAHVSDLQAGLFRDLTDAEVIPAQTWLDRAYRLLLARRPSLVEQVTAGSVSQATVIDVVCTMAGRVLLNPEGKVREAVDDYSYERSDTSSSGSLFVTPEELALVTPVAGSSSRSVRLTIYGDL